MNNRIYIVGAHSRSQTLGVYLKKVNKELSIEAYLVDNDEPNPDFIDKVPVIHFDEYTILENDYPVYLGTRGDYHQALINKLTQIGMKSIIPVTPQLDMELRNKFLNIYYKEKGRKFEKLDDYKSELSAKVYVIRSAFDKPLKKNDYSYSFYQKEIQVGAALTDEKICMILDNEGDNISLKNRQFCELTGVYWLWKHAKEDIIGVEHYRRHFLLPDDWKERMAINGIDVILPTPLFVAPSVAQNYRERHISSDWEYMMKLLNEIHPEDYQEAISFFDTCLYSPCNMFIMRKEILDDLCTWMFPILFECAEHGGKKDDVYQNRYPGFMAERLMSFFFEKNRNKFKMVYADKNFLN